MVFLMQSGFTSFETGMIRAKNSLNVAVKNISDFAIAVLFFWGIGFALMFGDSYGGWFGTSGFALSGISDSYGYAFFVFQAMFAGTAATIVSGAVAERMKFRSYLFISLIITSIVYPISGHWIWGSGINGEEMGWLENMGFVDFAGSTVVHSVGGWMGLAGALVLGPRIGRFDENGKPLLIPPQNLGTSTLGVFILWFGWFGFNGGSTLIVDESISKIFLNTMLSPAAAAVTCMGISISIEKSGLVRIEKLLNGVIAGLVGITAGCAFVEPVGAIWIGVISGFVLYGAEWFVLRFLKVDDPVGAISAHGFVGVWGTLAVALFAPLDLLPLNNMVDQLLVQLIGVTAVFFWTFSVGVIVFLVLKQMGVLRVSAKEELKGLNIVEHGAKSIWLDTMRSIQTVVNTGNLQKSVFVEPETESGEIAKSFNHLLGQLNHTFDNIRETMNDAMDGKERSVPVDGEVNSDLEQAKLWINQSTTKLVKLNKTLRNDALHDSLTGLPNRALLMDRLRIKIKQSNRERHPFALLFIDLDGFKQINDQLGHKQGDQLLINVANHLTESVRESDTVARLGGDEFVVILGGWKQLAELQDTIDRILQHLNQSFQGKEEDLLVSGSIGVSIYPDHGESEEQLIHNADQAMYQAKQAGKGCCRFYNYSAHL